MKVSVEVSVEVCIEIFGGYVHVCCVWMWCLLHGRYNHKSILS